MADGGWPLASVSGGNKERYVAGGGRWCLARWGKGIYLQEKPVFCPADCAIGDK